MGFGPSFELGSYCPRPPPPNPKHVAEPLDRKNIMYTFFLPSSRRLLPICRHIYSKFSVMHITCGELAINFNNTLNLNSA